MCKSLRHGQIPGVHQDEVWGGQFAPLPFGWPLGYKQALPAGMPARAREGMGPRLCVGEQTPSWASWGCMGAELPGQSKGLPSPEAQGVGRGWVNVSSGTGTMRLCPFPC